MDKPVIYIAMPYTAKNRSKINANLIRAQEAVEDIYNLGALAVFTPLMTDRFQGVFSKESMLKRDLWLLERCDAVFAGFRWQHSPGAQVEVNHAKSLNLPVFDSLAALKVWIKAKSKSQQRRLAIQGGIDENSQS